MSDLYGWHHIAAVGIVGIDVDTTDFYLDFIWQK